MDLHSLGKWLIGVGLLIALAGAIVSFMPKVPWLGKLPGDIFIKRGHATFYFPIVTCLALSLIVSLISRLFR
jgi:hypothetical protein